MKNINIKIKNEQHQFIVGETGKKLTPQEFAARYKKLGRIGKKLEIKKEEQS